MFLWEILSRVNVNIIWPPCSLVDARETRIFVWTWPVAGPLFGSTHSNDSLDVQFLTFCKCCSELFYDRGMIYSLMQKNKN